MSTIISKEQLDTFTVLLRSDIDRLNEIIEDESAKLEYLTAEELKDMIVDRDKFVKMCEDLGTESA